MSQKKTADAAAMRTGALAEVERKLYMPYPAEGHSYWINDGYRGYRGLDRFQVRTLCIKDDVYQDAMIRHSADNGRTWSEFVPYPERRLRQKGRFTREPYLGSSSYDPESRRMIRTILLRTHEGDPTVSGIKTYYDHTLWQTSSDGGQSWDQPKLLRYEDGADYDPDEFGDPDFLAHNQSDCGYNIIALKQGGVATGANLAVEITNEKGEKETVCGAVCFTGRWNAEKQTYPWMRSAPVALTKRLSNRGLMEAWVIELQSGDLFMDMRGNATAANPGRNFYALSKDRGRTWSEAKDLRYDDGGQFYAPSSMSSMFRHSATGTLYWFGNISAKPTNGNSPRYPLYIAEVDENQPALKHNTLTIIDDYDPTRHTPQIQFSNSAIHEDRETRDYTMYMTAMGEYPNVYTANVYHYIIRLK